MAEYEDAYPDAYGRRVEIDTASKFRRFLNFSRPRQVRDREPAIAAARRDAPQVVNIQEPASQRTPPASARHVDRPGQPLVHRTAREICDDAHEALASSPFIDMSGIVITVDDSDVTLDGTINSPIAISLAKALTTRVPGVSRVEVRLRVRPARRIYETPAETRGAPVDKIAYKIAAE